MSLSPDISLSPSISDLSLENLHVPDDSLALSPGFLRTLNDLRINNDLKPDKETQLTPSHVPHDSTEVLKLRFDLQLANHNNLLLTEEIERLRSENGRNEAHRPQGYRTDQSIRKHKELDELNAEIMALDTFKNSKGNLDVILEAMKEREQEIMFLRRKLKTAEVDQLQLKAKLDQAVELKKEVEDDMRLLLHQRDRMHAIKRELLSLTNDSTRQHYYHQQQLDYAGD